MSRLIKCNRARWPHAVQHHLLSPRIVSGCFRQATKTTSGFRCRVGNEISSRSCEKLRDVMNINDNLPTLL